MFQLLIYEIPYFILAGFPLLILLILPICCCCVACKRKEKKKLTDIEALQKREIRGFVGVTFVFTVGTLFLYVSLQRCIKNSVKHLHCVKSVRIFPHSDWIRREYVFLYVQFECGKIRTKKSPNTDTFYAMLNLDFL